ncbi:MAG: hypothetical protein ACOYON_15340 [Fimbriimonas sp.]
MRNLGVCIVAALIAIGGFQSAIGQDGGLEKKKPKTPPPSTPRNEPPPQPGPRPSAPPPSQPSNPPSNQPSNPPSNPQPSQGGGFPSPSRGGDPQPQDRNRGEEGGGRVQIGNDDALGRGKRPVQSRSGTVDYGRGNNNAQRQGRVEAPSFGRAPERIQAPSLESKVRREERISLTVNGYRRGYYHYDRRWTDNDFCYPHYAFDPYDYPRANCSPWYYYPTLPAYVNPARCVYVTSRPSLNWFGRDYRYETGRDGRYSDNSDLDATVDDIVRAFERTDRRAVGRITAARGNVHINMDGIYRYSLDADDFYDMFNDAIDSTRTLDYRILQVRTYRDSAQVIAQHDYRDPWGRRTTVYHTYFLEYERRSLVIREFGTSDRRW